MSYQIGTATDVGDLLAKLDAFLRVGHNLDPQYSTASDGVIDAILGTATSVQETISVTFADATNFSVAGSVSGNLGSGTCGVAFSSSVVSFTITAGTTIPFAIGDSISFIITPPWTRKFGANNVAIGSSSWNISTNPPDLVFDGLVSTWWAAAATTGWLEIDLPVAKTITSYNVATSTTQAAAQAPKTWTFEYWSGSAWVVADSRANITWASNGTKQSFTIATPPTATKFRLNVTVNSGDATNMTFGAFELIEQGTGTNVANGAPFAPFWYMAPGNDGSSQIFVGFQRFADSTGDYDNARLFGSTGLDTTMPWSSQAGYCSQPPVLPGLRIGAIPYWFTANGQRVVIAIKNSTYYEAAYLGFIVPYISPTLFPYPLAIGGSWAWSSSSEPAYNSTNWRWGYTGVEHQAFCKGGWNQGNEYSNPLRLRRPDGVWKGFGATNNGTGVITPENGIGTDLRPGVDGSYPIFPFVLSDNTPNIFGELDGVGWISGHANGAENIVTQNKARWVVMQNVFRTGKVDYFAIKLA